MAQRGQPAETMARSSAVSWDQPAPAGGSGAATPRWLSLRKQPFALVQGGSPKAAR